MCDCTMPASDFIELVLDALRRACECFHGERVVSLAVLDSHASGRSRRRSDIDLLIILTSAPRHHRLRLDQFDRLEKRLAPAFASRSPLPPQDLLGRGLDRLRAEVPWLGARRRGLDDRWNRVAKREYRFWEIFATSRPGFRPARSYIERARKRVPFLR